MTGGTVAGWRCATCGEMFPRYPPAERHVDKNHGGGRIEVLFDITPHRPPPPPPRPVSSPP